MDVLILAGGRCPETLKAATGVEFRALLPIGGKPMVATVIEAVRHLGEPIVVGQSGGLQVKSVPDGESFVHSLHAGLEAVRTERFLMATADLPFLTREAVDDFLSKADPTAQLNYPVLRAADCEREYPGMKRTTLRFREGEFTGGNLLLAETATMRALMPKIDQAYALRKSPAKLAALVGLRPLFQIALGRAIPWTLNLPSFEASVGRILGIRVRGIVCDFPSIGADIDNETQYFQANALKTAIMPADI